MHVLKLQIAHGKGVQRAKNTKKCLMTNLVRPFDDVLRPVPIAYVNRDENRDDSPCNYLSRKKIKSLAHLGAEIWTKQKSI